MAKDKKQFKQQIHSTIREGQCGHDKSDSGGRLWGKFLLLLMIFITGAVPLLFLVSSRRIEPKSNPGVWAYLQKNTPVPVDAGRTPAEVPSAPVSTPPVALETPAPIHTAKTATPDRSASAASPTPTIRITPQPATQTPKAPTNRPTEQPEPGTLPASAVPTASVPHTGGYDYSMPVPESAPVDWDYFEDAVFIGDSRMEDFALFTGMAKYATFYTHVGVSINSILSDNPKTVTRFLVNKEKLTLEEGLTKYNGFNKVYIMLGLNEIGWPYPSEFIKYYVRLLDLIRSINPEAQIYIECVIPMARQIRGSGVDPTYENNENVAVFNRYIREMCEQQKVYFLNVQEALVDQEGFLPDGAASDGIHMGKEYCLKWLEYVKCHIV